MKMMISRLPAMFKAFFLGLFIAQIVGTVQVYLSNIALYRCLEALTNAGYLAVPNQNIMQTLLGFRAAFFGGIFFTLSVGACITLSSIGAVWLWDRLFSRNIFVSIGLFSIWAGCLVMANIRGIEFMVSAYFLCIPGTVVFLAVRERSIGAEGKRWGSAVVYAGPLVLLVCLWLTQMNAHLFLDIRDHLLLSNRLGAKVNDFYYTYTLYPAEVFKSLHQKMLKTYCLKDIRDPSMAASLERRLANHDYLRLEEDAPVDVTISRRGAFLVFGRKQTDVLKVSPQTFFSSPGKLLREFSEKADKHRFFRRFTFFSLLIGFPIALYLFVAFVFLTLGGFFLTKRTSSWCASAMCLAIGLALFAVFVSSRGKTTEIRDIGSALESSRWQEKVGALKLIGAEDMEIADFQAYRGMLKNASIPVRYWLARCMGVSRKPETYDKLVELVHDPHPNVVSMSLYALSKRGNPRAISLILDTMNASHYWYSQWYAYKALRRLGWKQTESR